MISVAAVGAILILLAALGAVLLLIAADRTRYLARFDLSHWEDKLYLAQLPNFLQYVHDHGYTSPWPARMNAVSAAYFKHELRGILQDRPSLERRNFLHLHLNFQALLYILKPFLDDAILAEQVKITARQVLQMADSADRDRLNQFIDDVRRHRAEFISSLTKVDRQIIHEMQQRDFLGILRSANAIFHEHGFDNLLPSLDVIRHWRNLEGSEMVQQLPVLPKTSSSDLAKHTMGLMPQTAPKLDV